MTSFYTPIKSKQAIYHQNVMRRQVTDATIPKWEMGNLEEEHEQEEEEEKEKEKKTLNKEQQVETSPRKFKH